MLRTKTILFVSRVDERRRARFLWTTEILGCEDVFYFLDGLLGLSEC